MDLEQITLSEVGQADKDNSVYIFSYMWNLKKIKQMTKYNQTEIDSQVKKNYFSKL